MGDLVSISKFRPAQKAKPSLNPALLDIKLPLYRRMVTTKELIDTGLDYNDPVMVAVGQKLGHVILGDIRQVCGSYKNQRPSKADPERLDFLCNSGEKGRPNLDRRCKDCVFFDTQFMPPARAESQARSVSA